jgi:hypothetical protein
MSSAVAVETPEKGTFVFPKGNSTAEEAVRPEPAPKPVMKAPAKKAAVKAPAKKAVRVVQAAVGRVSPRFGSLG